MENISHVEIIWIVVSAIGVFVHLSNMLDAWRDLEAVERLGNGARHIFARGALRQEVYRLIAQVSIFILGIDAATRPPVPEAGFLSVHERTLLILMVVGGIALNSILDRRLRVALREAVGQWR